LAVASAIPDVAPVITATLPSNFDMTNSLSCRPHGRSMSGHRP
jgi:hypothetical protein